VLRRIESRDALEIAHRVHQYCSRVFRYGIAIGKCERDVAVDLRGAIATVKLQHRAAILEPAKRGELIRAIQGYQGYFVTQCACNRESF